jgi:hypothetical protein
LEYAVRYRGGLIDEYEERRSIGTNEALGGAVKAAGPSVSGPRRREPRKSNGDVNLEVVRPILRFLPLASVFTVWRQTSFEAIRKMMMGAAAGKGLDIKGMWVVTRGRRKKISNLL